MAKPNVTIELQPGESIQDAIKRIAKQTTPTEDVSQSPQRRSAKSRPQVTDPSTGDMVAGDIYSALHIYQREGESEGNVRYNGTRERKMHGPGTLVFCHMHKYGEGCTSACRERV